MPRSTQLIPAASSGLSKTFGGFVREPSHGCELLVDRICSQTVIPGYQRQIYRLDARTAGRSGPNGTRHQGEHWLSDQN
jgi:hypothetical protein